mgnify:CR=1 FL=1
MKKYSHLLPLPLFNSRLYVVIGQSYEKLNKFAKTIFYDDFAVPTGMCGLTGQVLTFYENESLDGNFILWLKDSPFKSETANSFLIHEVTHMVFYLLERTGMPKDTELCAHLAAWLYLEIRALIKGGIHATDV